MSCRLNQSQPKSNDADYVPDEQYQPRSHLPPEFEELRIMPTFEPYRVNPIINPGPNLPTDFDIDDPMAFFRLFWTDEVLQYVVDCTNRHAKSQRDREDNTDTEMWRPINQIDIEIYLGTSPSL
jgi:hypothetical protein